MAAPRVAWLHATKKLLRACLARVQPRHLEGRAERQHGVERGLDESRALVGEEDGAGAGVGGPR